MGQPKLYRRRFIPDETVYLKGDEVLHADSGLIVTKWRTIKPRNDFSHGISCYFMAEGFKVSRFYRESGELVYTYCDIIETEYQEETDSYIFNDLLVDVIVENDGFVKVLDIGEVMEALAEGLITMNQARLALSRLERLLQLVYDGKFHQFTAVLDQYDDKS